MLFPPFLNAGSYGDAVTVLQILLIVIDPECHGLEVTGIHAGWSVKAVKRLQIRLGFTGKDVNGNFGPGTRAALKEELGMDVDCVPVPKSVLVDYTQWMGPHHEGEALWTDA